MKTAWNEHFNIIGQMRSLYIRLKKSPSECGFYPFLYILYQVNDEYSKVKGLLNLYCNFFQFTNEMFSLTLKIKTNVGFVTFMMVNCDKILNFKSGCSYLH